MSEQVHVIYAVNTSDFDEMPIMAAGRTREAAEISFFKKVKERWEKWTNAEDKAFYENDLDNYERVWNKDEFITELA